MKAVGFALEQIFYPETTVRANIDYEKGSTEEPTEGNLKIFVYKSGDHSYQVSMHYRLEALSDADPYDINVLAVARIRCADDLNGELRSQVLSISAPNMLYGAIREHVLTLTCKSAWKDFVLPPVIIEPSDFVADDDEEDLI